MLLRVKRLLNYRLQKDVAAGYIVAILKGSARKSQPLVQKTLELVEQKKKKESVMTDDGSSTWWKDLTIENLDWRDTSPLAAGFVDAMLLSLIRAHRPTLLAATSLSMLIGCAALLNSSPNASWK